MGQKGRGLPFARAKSRDTAEHPAAQAPSAPAPASQPPAAPLPRRIPGAGPNPGNWQQRRGPRPGVQQTAPAAWPNAGPANGAGPTSPLLLCGLQRPQCRKPIHALSGCPGPSPRPGGRTGLQPRPRALPHRRRRPYRPPGPPRAGGLVLRLDRRRRPTVLGPPPRQIPRSERTQSGREHGPSAPDSNRRPVCLRTAPRRRMPGNRSGAPPSTARGAPARSPPGGPWLAGTTRRSSRLPAPLSGSREPRWNGRPGRGPAGSARAHPVLGHGRLDHDAALAAAQVRGGGAWPWR